MTKREFMNELGQLLNKIPYNEKEDAMQYYSDYFAEAQISDDMEIPASIGTPRQVADKIIAEATDREKAACTVDNKQEKDNSSRIILFIVLAICLSPIWVSVAGSVLGLIFGIGMGMVGMIIGFAVAGITLIVTAFLSSGFSGAIILFGLGIIFVALTLLIIALLVLYCGKLLPWIIKGIVDWVKKMMGRKELA